MTTLPITSTVLPIQSGDNWRLQVFVAVVDHGGFSAAAEYLDLGQPTISFRVKALERLLGARLLTYREQRVHLTAEGEALYQFASTLLRDTERVAASIRTMRDGQAGALRIGASMAFELPAPLVPRCAFLSTFPPRPPGYVLNRALPAPQELALESEPSEISPRGTASTRCPANGRRPECHRR